MRFSKKQYALRSMNNDFDRDKERLKRERELAWRKFDIAEQRAVAAIARGDAILDAKKTLRLQRHPSLVWCAILGGVAAFALNS
jgi:hypothetical protein